MARLAAEVSLSARRRRNMSPWVVPTDRLPAMSRRQVDAESAPGHQGRATHAFGRLFDRWVDRLVEYITRFVCDQAIAAEVAQDVLLERLAEARRAAGTGGVRALAAALGRNEAVTRIRKEARSSAVGDLEDMSRLDRAPVAGRRRRGHS